MVPTRRIADGWNIAILRRCSSPGRQASSRRLRRRAGPAAKAVARWRGPVARRRSSGRSRRRAPRSRQFRLAPFHRREDAVGEIGRNLAFLMQMAQEAARRRGGHLECAPADVPAVAKDEPVAVPGRQALKVRRPRLEAVGEKGANNRQVTLDCCRAQAAFVDKEPHCQPGRPTGLSRILNSQVVQNLLSSRSSIQGPGRMRNS